MDDRIQLSNGYFVTVDLLRHTGLSAREVAALVGMPADDFLREVDRWSQTIGVPFGIRVDRIAQAISCVQ